LCRNQRHNKGRCHCRQFSLHGSKSSGSPEGHRY
jgi:hypothetical protein